MSESDSSQEEPYLVRGQVGSTRTVVIEMPSGWTRAALSGVEAALLGWAVPTVLGVYGLLAEGANPWLEQVDLSQAASVGTSLWALSLGAPVALGGLRITLIPLLWTILQVLLLRLLLRQGKGGTAAAQWFAVPAFLVTAILALVFSPGYVQVAGILLGATLVPLVASGWAATSRGLTWPRPFRWSADLGRGFRLGLLWLAVSFGFGLATLLFSAIPSWTTSSDIAAAIGAEGVSGALLGVLETLYVPTFAAWGLAWCAGPGFSLSGGLPSSPTTLATGDLPAFPVSALVPTTAPGNAIVLYVIAAGIVVGLGTGWALRQVPFKEALVRLAVAAGTFCLLLGAWFALASGALGNDLMSRLGPMPTAWPFVMLEFGLPAIACALAVHPASINWARELGLLIADKAKSVSAAE